MQFSDLDFQGAARITNLPDAIGLQEPATLAQVTAAIEGIKWKEPVTLAEFTNNIDIASAPATFDDGFTLEIDRRDTGSILLGAQTDTTENGVWIFNGEGLPMTRALDFNSTFEANNAVVPISQGTYADTSWRQGYVDPVIDGNSLFFYRFGDQVPQATEVIAGKTRYATQAEVDDGTATDVAITPATFANWVDRLLAHSMVIGDGVTTSFTINHNRGSQNIVGLTVLRNAAPYDAINVRWFAPTANTVVVEFNAALPPATDEFIVNFLI